LPPLRFQPVLPTYENIFAAKTLGGGIDVFNFFSNIEQSEAQVRPRPSRRGPPPPPPPLPWTNSPGHSLQSCVASVPRNGCLPLGCTLRYLSQPSSSTLEGPQLAQHQLCASSAPPVPHSSAAGPGFTRPSPHPVRPHPEQLRTTTLQVSAKHLKKG
jgi:hypothetical protein